MAKRRAEEKNGLYTNQFFNAYNLKAHYETTGPEIWQQTGKRLDAIVMAMGTGNI